jgi:hypothetical protein
MNTNKYVAHRQKRKVSPRSEKEFKISCPELGDTLPEEAQLLWPEDHE